MAYSRQDVRIDTLIDAKLTATYDELGALLPVSLELDCKVTNVSATGMSIECVREFPSRSSFFLNVDIAGMNLNIVLQIMRKEKLESGMWFYGCKFIDLDEKDETAIRKYIFDTQVMLRRKEKFNNEKK
ncbi:MAG: PilZ domain-containing protein [Clostridia bacterium]|nr:PilZ domain-containing protein [Clostridia bacterium]